MKLVQKSKKYVIVFRCSQTFTFTKVLGMA